MNFELHLSLILINMLVIVFPEETLLPKVEVTDAKDQNVGSQNEKIEQRSLDENDNNMKTEKISLSKKDIYKAGFQVKRAHQIAAVKQILKLGDYTKQYKMVSVVLEKIFQVLASSKLVIAQSGYVPGQDFPENQTELDSLAHIVENTAFFGDILLRMPDITHKIYRSKNEWRILVNWSVGFCNETGLFSGQSERVISLMAQELNLVARDPNYVNPYKAEHKKDSNKDVKSGKEQKKQKNKKKLKKKKKPRLSRTDL